MAQSVTEFFEGLPSRADPDKIAGVNNTYRFDIEGAGTWTVDVRDGEVNVAQDGDAEPDVTITTSRGEVSEAGQRRAEPDHGLHDRQAEDQGRHGRGHEAPETVLVAIGGGGA